MGNDCKWCYGSVLMYTQVLLASVIFKTPNVDLKPILKWAVSSSEVLFKSRRMIQECETMFTFIKVVVTWGRWAERGQG